MRVLYITNYPSPYAVDFFNEMGRYCSLTITFEMKPSEVKERDEKWFASSFVNFKGVFLNGKNFFNKRICTEIKNYLNDSFDIVIMGEYSSLTEMYAIRYMKKHKIKYAFAIDGGLKKNGRGFKEELKKYLLSGAEFYLSSGRPTDEYLMFYGVPKDKIFRYPFTPLGDDDILKEPISRAEMEKLKKELSVKENKVVLAIGQFIKRKGFDVLIKASSNLKDVGIYFVGGEATDEYVRLKDELNLSNVHFVGFKSKEELKKYYMISDVFVLPTREDIWGLVINEAMAYALPVVSTDKCVAALELIDEGKGGFIVPSENVEALSNAVNNILENEDLRINMSRYNLLKISDYTIANMAKRHIEIINDYLEK